MSRFEHHRRGHPGLERFLPASRAEAPAIAGMQAGKFILGMRGDEVVTTLGRELKKILCDYDTDGVDSMVARTGMAITIPVKSRPRFKAAGLKIAAQYIFCHVQEWHIDAGRATTFAGRPG